jgi:catechol 2,3-dioxygenase-like lactoylglutathione lyase family enzyme
MKYNWSRPYEKLLSRRKMFFLSIFAFSTPCSATTAERGGDTYMQQHIAHIALVVNDYDEAIRYYTQVLQFELWEDIPMGDAKRWVLIAPKGSAECKILLAKAVGKEQESRVGNQTGGRVFLFLHTDDFWRDYRDFSAKGVEFVRPPSTETYGTVAVFKDLYGNLWDLIEPAGASA